MSLLVSAPPYKSSAEYERKYAIWKITNVSTDKCVLTVATKHAAFSLGGISTPLTLIYRPYYCCDTSNLQMSNILTFTLRQA